ncbi:hypothetical protein YC2023_007435 [Brassica napus]
MARNVESSSSDSSTSSSPDFSVGNEELPHMYTKRLGDPKRLGDTGYLSYKFGRTNNLSDGLLTALPKDYFRAVNSRGVLFNDCSD